LKKTKKVLLIGGSGTLGSSIVKLRIFKNLGFKIAKDASMNLNLLKRIKGKLWKKSL